MAPASRLTIPYGGPWVTRFHVPDPANPTLRMDLVRLGEVALVGNAMIRIYETKGIKPSEASGRH